MFVERLLPTAREKLVTIAEDAPLVDAAKLLGTRTDRGGVRFCRPSGRSHHKDGHRGPNQPLSRSELHHGSFIGDDTRRCALPTGRLAARRLARMKKRRLKNVPVVDQDSRPLGVLSAPDMLQALLQEAEDKEAVFRDYVMGVGYR